MTPDFFAYFEKLDADATHLSADLYGVYMFPAAVKALKIAYQKICCWCEDLSGYGSSVPPCGGCEAKTEIDKILNEAMQEIT